MQDGAVSRDQDIMSILAGTPRNVTTNTSGTTKSTQNPGWLNTRWARAQIGASFFSDERLKRDIVRVGELEDGLPVVDFNYRDGLGFPKAASAASRSGRRAAPAARAGPDVNGFATVNYAWRTFKGSDGSAVRAPQYDRSPVVPALGCSEAVDGS
jgi:hypothetical protein